jgi:hypothetical protein
MANRRRDFLCPKCGEYGFLTKRWVQSSYYPKYASTSCKRLEEELVKLEQNPADISKKKNVEFWRSQVKGNRYRLDETKELFDREACYRVYTQKYTKYYVGHYDKEKYEEQMKQFNKNKRKSKPNGRRWCGPIKYQSTSYF